MTAEAIVRQIYPNFNAHVVITGGEPTLYNLDELLTLCIERHYYTQLETSGQQWLKGRVVPSWITWSPKRNLKYDIPSCALHYVNEVKWVVDELLEWNDVWGAWGMFTTGVKPYFILMPEGCPPRAEMVAKAMSFLRQAKNPLWRYGDRLQYRIGVK